jgi:outer membrane protein assembly factor BamB
MCTTTSSNSIPGVVAFVAFCCGLLLTPGPREADGRTDEPTGKTTSSPAVTKPAGKPEPVSTFRGDPQRTGVVTGTHLPDRPSLKVTVETDGDAGQPLVSEGVIYFGIRNLQGGGGGTVCAVRPKDGSLLWRNDGIGQVTAAPARRGDRIYVSSEKGLTALTRDEGKMVWTFEIKDGAGESSPLPLKDHIIVAGYDGNVYAMGYDGRLVWKHDIVADEPPSPPEFDSKRAVIGAAAARPGTAASDGVTVFQPVFNQSRLIAIDVESGKRRWSFQAKGWIYPQPTVAEDRVFVGSQDDHLYCFDKKTGTVLWKFPTKSRIEAGAAYHDGSVYFGSCDGHFYRVNAVSGKEVWNFQTPARKGVSTAIYSAPLCTGDLVYFGSFDGHLYCLKADGGGLKWRYEPEANSEIVSSPVTDGRRVILSLRKNFEKQGFNGTVFVGDAEE